jgi:antitoxin (DNA-binding transcriptional repressor) of toxin-antitoxin stability system
VNVHQAKTHLSLLLQEVEQGQEVVIARSGVPIAWLVAWQAPARPVAAPGAMRGQIQLSGDSMRPWMGWLRPCRDTVAAQSPLFERKDFFLLPAFRQGSCPIHHRMVEILKDEVFNHRFLLGPRLERTLMATR